VRKESNKHIIKRVKMAMTSVVEMNRLPISDAHKKRLIEDLVMSMTIFLYMLAERRQAYWRERGTKSRRR
jgi:hypothetical protein